MRDGAQQGWGRLWAPWRRRYVTHPSQRGCLFCRIGKGRDDRRNRILHRSRHAFVLLNRYPYNNGHLLIAPYAHVANLGRLNDPEVLDVWHLADRFVRHLGKRLAPHGYNLGINLGRSSGAGVVGHLHLHVVPRWNGDTNFVPVAAGTKVISDSLDALYRSLR